MVLKFSSCINRCVSEKMSTNSSKAAKSARPLSAREFAKKNKKLNKNNLAFLHAIKAM